MSVQNIRVALGIIVSWCSLWGFVKDSTCSAGEGFPTTVMWATVKVVNPGSTATAVLVRSPEGKPVLLSANHVFSAMQGDECTVILHRRDESGRFQTNPKPLTIRREGKPLWRKHPTVDLAAISVPFSEEDNLAVLPWESLASTEDLEQIALQPGDTVRGVGFPHGNAFKGSPLEFGVVRMGCLAGYPFLPVEPGRTFLVDMNIFEGDSGGPLYAWNLQDAAEVHRGANKDGLILGVMIAQHFVDEEYKLIYATGKYRHRMGLAIVAPAPFAREIVESIGKEEPPAS
ncbi:serine protease family protein [Thermopirellula anaerolimosa]